MRNYSSMAAVSYIAILLASQSNQLQAMPSDLARLKEATQTLYMIKGVQRGMGASFPESRSGLRERRGHGIDRNQEVCASTSAMGSIVLQNSSLRCERAIIDSGWPVF